MAQPQSENPIILDVGSSGFVRLGNYEHEIGTLSMTLNVDSEEISVENRQTGAAVLTSRPWQDFTNDEGTFYNDHKAVQAAWKTANTPR